MDYNSTPLVNNNYLLQKMPGKGGWTFAAISEITQDKHAWFGWVKVKGTIDGYEISNYHLMPLGNGTLFLALKAQIRKAIGKNEGDMVHIILYSQDLPPVSEQDFYTCLNDEPTALQNFNQLALSEQKKIVDWIFSVKNDDLRVERIGQSIEKLLF